MSDFDDKYDYDSEEDELQPFKNEDELYPNDFDNFPDINPESNFDDDENTSDTSEKKYEFDLDKLEAIPKNNETKKPFIPGDNNIHKAIETFEQLTQLVFDLEYIANKSRKENKILLELSKKNKIFLETLEGKEKLLDNLQRITNNLSSVVSSSNKIEKAILNIPSNLTKYYSSLKENLEKEKDEYKKEFEKLINSLASNVDIKVLSKNLNEKISSMVDSAGVKNINKHVNELKDITLEINEIVKALSSKEESGLIQNFSRSSKLLNENLKDFNTEINKTLRKPKIINYAILSISSFFIGCSAMFIFMNIDFDNKLESVIFKKRESIENFYKNKIDSLEVENKAYQDYLKKYNTTKDNFGFSYFNDTNKPYFYYKKDLRSFEYENKIYIPIQ